MAFEELIKPQMRQGKTAVLVRGGVKIPASAQAVTVRAVLDSTALIDPELAIQVDVHTSDDGVNWRYDCGFGYEAAKYDPLNISLPWMRCRGDALAAWREKFLKVELDVVTRKVVGVEVEVL